MPQAALTAKDVIGLVAVLLVAVLLRVLAIDSQALWGDEGQTLSLALYPIHEMLFNPTDPTPFLYYTLHHLFLSPDSSVVQVRLLPTIISLLQFVPMYLCGRLLFDRGGGLVAVALLAVWTSHVDYSMEARSYSLFGLTTLTAMLGFILFIKTVREGGPAWRVPCGLTLFAVGNVLSFYTHTISVFPIFAWNALLFVVVALYHRSHFKALLVAHAVMAMLALPGIYRLLIQLKTGDDFGWLHQASAATVISTLADFFLPIGFWDNPLTDALDIRLVAKAVCIPLFVLVFLVAVYRNRTVVSDFARRLPELAAFALVCATIPIVVWLAGYVLRPLFLGRITLFCVPVAILFLTMLVMAQPLGRPRQIAASGLIGLWLVSTLSYGLMRDKEDWRGANTFLAGAVGPHDVVLVCPSFYFPSLRHAAKGELGRLMLATSIRRKELTLLEPGLGSSPTWATDYFAALQRYRPMPQKTITLEPGQAIWRVDAVCFPGNAEHDAIDALLKTIDSSPTEAWSMPPKYHDHIQIRRYDVETPVQLTVSDAYRISAK